MEQSAPTYRDLDEQQIATVLSSLDIGRRDLAARLRPCVVNTGNSFLLIPLASERTLASLVPDQMAILSASEALELIGYYPFAVSEPTSGFAAITRMFAPRFGIAEESATGTAAGPLACFLHDRGGNRSQYVHFAQGQLMQPSSPSTLVARLELDEVGIHRVFVGGKAYLASTLAFEI